MIRYYLNLLWFIISRNPVKLALLVTAFVSFFFAGTFPKVAYKKEVLIEHKEGPDWIYVVRDKNKETGYDILTSQVRHQLSDNYLSIESYNELNVLIWILFGICSIVLFIMTIVGIHDVDIGWEIEDCKEMAVNNLVRCELEDGIFYYIAIGRLLGKSNIQVRGVMMPRHFSIYSLSDLKRCPKFSTKEDKRNNILEKIGIN